MRQKETFHKVSNLFVMYQGTLMLVLMLSEHTLIQRITVFFSVCGIVAYLYYCVHYYRYIMKHDANKKKRQPD